jgi:signal transduction histidine kinase
MQLGLIANSHANRVQLIDDASEIVDRCLAETRTVSHLLHPPLLDEAGFGSAARWFIEGFAERSGIAVHLDLPPGMRRLPAEIEIALFRALQESLTNVHRHASTPKVDIRLALDPNQIRMEIQDYGQGIPPEVLRHLDTGVGKTGIGLAGMRERVRELGGSLNIHSSHQGTVLTIVLPLANSSDSSPTEASLEQNQIPAA